MRRLSNRRRGVRKCRVCGRPVPALQQHDRWLHLAPIVICTDCNRKTDVELWASLQQPLALDNEANPNP